MPMEECDCDSCRGGLVRMDEMVEEFLIRTRRLLLVGDINEELSTHICSNLQMLSLIPDPIYMYVNGTGGCLASGYAIIDQMRMCRCPIYTIVRGNAYSMSAMIAASGKKGCRYSMPSSSFMIHNFIIGGGSDTVDKHAAMVDYMKRDCRSRIQVFARNLKITAKQLEELMNETKWMTPKEAMKIGLIDGIWTPRMERKIG